MPTSGSAARAVDSSSLVQLAQRLIRIASPTGSEGKIAEYLASYMESLGLSAELQQLPPGESGASRYNAIGRLVGDRKGPRLLLTGHTDVVPPGSSGWSEDPYSGTLSGGRLFGRGSADMKGGIASMVEAVCSLLRSGISLAGEVMLAFVVGEEVDQSGSRRLIEEYSADFAYVGEPTELKPIVCHNGLVSVQACVRGRAAHASRPQEGLNAIDGMFRFLERLQPLRDEIGRRRHPLTGTASLTPGTIRGGEVSNMVPDECVLCLDRRLIPGERAGDALEEIRAIASSVQEGAEGFHYDIISELVEEPLETEPDHAAVRALRKAAEAETGRDPGYHGWTATCDAGLLETVGKIPSVVYGPGSISQAHTPNEYIDVEEMNIAARVFARTVERLLCTGADVDTA